MLPIVKYISLCFHSSGNRLTKLPQKFLSQLLSLEILHCGGNRIENITTECMNSLAGLKELHMHGCYHNDSLQICPDAFQNSYKLTKISVTNCPGFEHIQSGTFTPLPKLESLEFKNCGLRTVDADVADWNNLSQLDLTGNPLDCNCTLAWLSKFFLGRLRNQTHFPNPK